MAAMFQLDHVSHHYGEGDEGKVALSDINLSISPGEFVAVIGHNGSGKSTLAKHLNALLLPTTGTVLVKGMDTRDSDHLWAIRQTAGMVFQNPDNQMVATAVEEDVAFGPENLGVPTAEIRQRVEAALKLWTCGNSVLQHRIFFPADKNSVLPLPVYWPCSRRH